MEKEKDDDEEFVLREPIAAYGKKKCTIEEYLEFEEASEQRHEYYKGEIFSIPIPNMQHLNIKGNIYRNLRKKLKGTACYSYFGSQRIHIPENTLFTYPDLIIACGKVNTMHNDENTIMNPAVICEVLSISTQDYDRGEKFTLYRDIPTLKEYILIDSRKIHAEIFSVSASGKWERVEYKSLRDKLRISSVDVIIPLKQVYEFLKMENNKLVFE